MTYIARTLRTSLRPSCLPPTCVASTSKLPLTLARPNSTSSTILETTPTPEAASSTDPTPVRYSYFVPRVGKTLSSFPVYTDVRNGGTRTLTEVRKIQGSISDLKTDLSIFLSETYAETASDDIFGEGSPFKVNKKPLRVKPGRKLIEKTANPSYLDPVQTGKVVGSGKLKIRGNRVDAVKAFLESRGF